MCTIRISLASFLLILSCSLTPVSQIKAAILAYDGFESGGATPTASQYHTSGGYTNDAIAYYPLDPVDPKSGQNPITWGFSGAWDSVHNTSSVVYPRALATSLNYTSSDAISLITTNGSASYFRSGSSTVADKTIRRDISVSGAIPSTLYFSVLVNFDSNQPIHFATQTLGESIKPTFGFGIDTSGFAYLTLGGVSQVVSTSALAANTTHLLVMKVEQHPTMLTTDTLSLYVNPLLGSEAANTDPLVYQGDFFVANNAAYELTDLSITARPNNGRVVFDEFRISTDWNDIAIAVPEPSKMAFLSIATVFLLGCRRRNSR